MWLNDEGYTDLPAGKLVNIATFLEMHAQASRPRPLINLTRITPSLEEYRAMFIKIGSPWLWFSRLEKSDATLAAIIYAPTTFIYFYEDFGLLELDFSKTDECELVYYGLASQAIGQGYGRNLMDFAIHTAFSQPVSRFWLHTCTLDSPQALPFYIKSGFKPYKRAIEMADDPRLNGLIAPHHAPHFPLI